MSFIQRELDRIGEALRADAEAADYDRLYAAQQALAWVTDPQGFKSPFQMIGCQQGRGCALNRSPAPEPAPPGIEDLSSIATPDINGELIGRAGVEAMFLGPDDRLTKTLFGPAWVIVSRD